MIIHNLLEPFIESLRRWDKPPSLADFREGYFRHLEPLVRKSFWIDDARGFHGVLADLNWELYRQETLALDPAREEARLRKHLGDVERLFGFPLEGEIVLFGAFTMMDGFARFDRGRHKVFLGVDESHGRGAYLDVLETHELTHVARESRPEVWQGWGLDPKMSRHEFGESQPVIEHVFGEGFSCAVSELLVPGEPAWHYAYQTEDSLRQALEHGPALDHRIKEEIRKRHDDSNYGHLYDPEEYKGEYGGARVPDYAHYVWAWQWVKQLLRSHAGGDARKLVTMCSKDLIESALEFELKSLA